MADHVSWRASLDLLAESTARVVDTAAGLDDTRLREPSLLPGWTRGHVISHLARNADALHNLTVWAATGVETPAYASSEARDADIEAGAGESGERLVAELARASERLRDGLDALDEQARSVKVRLRDGAPLGAHTLPTIRIRELEIHHVDLDAGYGPADWPADFVTVTLEKLSPMFAGRGDVLAHALHADDGRTWVVGPPAEPTLHGSAADLLVWLIGRDLPIAVTTAQPGIVPPSPQW